MLSRRFATLSAVEQTRVRGVLEEFPAEIVTLDVREFTPVMAALSTVVTVNFLTAEAVATALVLDATLMVSTSSPLLERASRRAGTEIIVVP
jgi:hypothetical protein